MLFLGYVFVNCQKQHYLMRRLMMKEQKVLIASEEYSELDEYLENNLFNVVLLVCDSSLRFLRINNYFNNLEDRLGIKLVRFDDFNPNPLYESVEKGVDIFHREKCDSIIAIGGGSAIDVAKCIKLYSNMDTDKNYLKQEIIPNDVKLLAIPTTAGTGSEATRYAVIYYKGEKQSVADYSCIPDTVLMDSSVLKTLPIYQKKSTMMDALCHAIESFWSVNSTPDSQHYSEKAIQLILENRKAYLENSEQGNARMLEAANIAGKAINITQTTAGHAMCYKLTSMYGIAHGHAAALCVSKLWPYMVQHIDDCLDPRGPEYLQAIFEKMACAFGCVTVEAAIGKYNALLDELELNIPSAEKEDYAMLKKSVNPVRLKNNPVKLTIEAIDILYHQILRKK